MKKRMSRKERARIFRAQREAANRHYENWLKERGRANALATLWENAEIRCREASADRDTALKDVEQLQAWAVYWKGVAKGLARYARI